MKEIVQKIINDMNTANEVSKALLAYNLFRSEKATDDKEKATYKMRADSFDETIKEKEKEVASVTEFLESL